MPDLSQARVSWSTIAISVVLASSGTFISWLAVTQNPLNAVALWFAFLLLSLLLTSVGRFLMLIYRASEDTAYETLKTYLDEYFSRQFKTYRQCILNAHWYFDVKGIDRTGTTNLELSRVFVELSIKPEINARSGVIPQAIPPDVPKGNNPLWAYLTGTQRHHFVIIGAPGTGKTTLLKHAALILVGGWRKRWQIGAPHKLPIVIFLRKHVQAIKNLSEN